MASVAAAAAFNSYVHRWESHRQVWEGSLGISSSLHWWALYSSTPAMYLAHASRSVTHIYTWSLCIWPLEQGLAHRLHSSAEGMNEWTNKWNEQGGQLSVERRDKIVAKSSGAETSVQITAQVLPGSPQAFSASVSLSKQVNIMAVLTSKGCHKNWAGQCKWSKCIHRALNTVSTQWNYTYRDFYYCLMETPRGPQEEM